MASKSETPNPGMAPPIPVIQGEDATKKGKGKKTEQKKPEVTEVPKNKVFIGGIPIDYDEGKRLSLPREPD